MKLFFYILFIFLTNIVIAQKDISAIQTNLEKHISFLADDKLEGRRAGSTGEKIAGEYIAQQFKLNGLVPKGTNGFYQPFEINDGRAMAAETSLTVDGKELVKNEDYFVFPYSSNAVLKTKPVIVSLDSILSLSLNNPHFDLENAIYKKAEALQLAGATNLFFISSTGDDLKFNRRLKNNPLKIPVVYINKEKARLFKANSTIKLNSKIIESQRTGHNIIGYIDNKAPNTVVLGAHYDHLGYGEDGGSTWRGEGRQIHNGADDNASGTSALIELARLLKSSKNKNNNYLFIAFSAEEIGLFGSKFFVDNPTISLSSVNYMINMDMVGRLNDSSKTITVGGFGTSPQWAGVITDNENFKIKIDSSGAGPSDHTSFYRKDIPVLFYFTGLHQDYHKPSDDFDRINYRGAAVITQSIFDLINKLDKAPKLAFTKTRERQVVNTSFKVTLGIMPDYTFSGRGVKADGVTEGRPAATAGIKAGDVITQIGEIPIVDMNAYMKALGSFKKGDVATVKFNRGSEEKEVQLTF